MHKIFLPAFMICLAMINVSFSNTPLPVNTVHSVKKAETAVVYIYRVGQFSASAANWALFADGEKICKLSNNKFIKHEVSPGKHVYSAKVGGVGLLKKETEIEIDAEAGKSYYIACNVKTSITRARLELIEVTKSSGEKQMAKMSLDNCQDKIDATDTTK